MLFRERLSSWSAIRSGGGQLLHTCLAAKQGGAAIFTGTCPKVDYNRIC